MSRPATGTVLINCRVGCRSSHSLSPPPLPVTCNTTTGDISESPLKIKPLKIKLLKIILWPLQIKLWPLQIKLWLLQIKLWRGLRALSTDNRMLFLGNTPDNRTWKHP